MNEKINYQKKLDQLLAALEKEWQGAGESQVAGKSQVAAKPSLLLHACCGPCSSYVLEYLSKYFQITVLYYNPNIYPQAEYERRLAELKKLYQRFPPVLEEGVKLVECEYQPEQFYDAIGVREEPELAHEKEKGERCRRCYEFRLERAADYAAENNFDYFCTTLSISPFKDAVKINEVGVEIEEEIFGQLQKSREGSDAGADTKVVPAAGGSCEPANQKSPKWLFSDFKKKGGFKRSLELSEEYGMYRQTYCGCVYSMNSRCCPSE